MKQISKDAQSIPWPGCLYLRISKIPTALELHVFTHQLFIIDFLWNSHFCTHPTNF